VTQTMTIVFAVFVLKLPDIPYFTGAPVFEPHSPASQNEATREMKAPVFQLDLSVTSHHTPIRLFWQPSLVARLNRQPALVLAAAQHQNYILFDAIIEQCNIWTHNLSDWFFGFCL